MSRYTLAYVGFNAQQQESISAVLYFAASALEDEWEAIAIAADSHISFINLDAENGEQLLQEQQQLKADYCLVLVAAAMRGPQFDGYWSLEKKELAPLSLRKLTELLNQVSVCLATIAESPVEEVHAIAQQFIAGGVQIEEFEEQFPVRNEDTQDEPTETQPVVQSVQQELPGFDFNLTDELDDAGNAESAIPDFNIEQLDVEPVETQVDALQALAELDFLIEEPLNASEEFGSQQEVSEQQEYIFELDLESVLTMVDNVKPVGRGKKEVSEFVSKVVDDLNSAAVTQQSQVIPDVKIVLPTRILSVRNYFFGLLQLTLKDKACRIIRLADLPLLYVLPDNNQFYFAGTDNQLMQLLIADPKQLKVRTVKKAQLEKLLARTAGLQSQALDALFVRAVLSVSQGRLLKGHMAERKVELKTWQDHVDVAQLKEYAKIAEVMQQQPNDLYALAESLQVPLATLFDFYNICYLLGCIRMLPAEVNKAVQPDKRKKTLGHFLRSFFKK